MSKVNHKNSKYPHTYLSPIIPEHSTPNYQGIGVFHLATGSLCVFFTITSVTLFYFIYILLKNHSVYPLHRDRAVRWWWQKLDHCTRKSKISDKRRQNKNTLTFIAVKKNWYNNKDYYRKGEMGMTKGKLKQG